MNQIQMNLNNKKNLIVIFGVPGAGKGVSAQLLKSKYKVAHISMGDLLRKYAENKIGIGIEHQADIEGGTSLVPCEAAFGALYQEIIKHMDDHKQIIIDGFPRTIFQLNLLNDLAEKHSVAIKFVLFDLHDENESIRRLTTRLHCNNCGWDYILEIPKNGLQCNFCDNQVVQRPTDTKETISKRFETYRDTTLTVVRYLQSVGKIDSIDCTVKFNEIPQMFLKYCQEHIGIGLDHD